MFCSYLFLSRMDNVLVYVQFFFRRYDLPILGKDLYGPGQLLAL